MQNLDTKNLWTCAVQSDGTDAKQRQVLNGEKHLRPKAELWAEAVQISTAKVQVLHLFIFCLSVTNEI